MNTKLYILPKEAAILLPTHVQISTFKMITHHILHILYRKQTIWLDIKRHRTFAYIAFDKWQIFSHVVLNIIKDYEVVEKRTVVLPDEIVGLVKCNNPKCITNNEPMPSRFEVIDKEKGTLKCHYCERKINKEDIIIKEK